ncbi:MAG TPA: GNAT family N-acetyltransferase [Catenuloplanes sp.]
MEPVEIRADGMLLRAWRPDDAEAMYRACQDADIQRWTPIPSPYPMEEAVTYVTERSPNAWAAGTGAPMAVTELATGRLLGFTGLVRLNLPEHTAELGYWVAPWARGHNVAERAGRVVARWAFTDLGIERLVWCADPGNHASRLIAWRLGFRMEGTLRLGSSRPDGRRADLWIGAMLAGELLDAAADSPAAPGTPRARQAYAFMAAPPVLTVKAGAQELRLRAPAGRDLDALVASCQDPEAMRWTTVPQPYQRSDAEFFVHQHAPHQWAQGQGAVFVIAGPDDAHVGTMDLRLGTDPMVGEVGFLVAPQARGRGYASAALRAVAGWGFAALGLTRIEWRAHVGNTASRRVAEKAGFTVEGIARAGLAHHGQRRDVWVAARLADDPEPPQ